MRTSYLNENANINNSKSDKGKMVLIVIGAVIVLVNLLNAIAMIL
jgi:hypothetical protein